MLSISAGDYKRPFAPVEALFAGNITQYPNV